MAPETEISPEGEPIPATAQSDIAVTEPDAGDGDFAGPFGYGRKAHTPDPAATYVFEPGPPRTLPIKPANRWR